MADTPDFGSIDLTDFTVGAMLRAGIALRRAVRGTTTLEAAADVVARYLYDRCRDPTTGARSCALVRFYKTHRYAALPPDLQEFARRRLGDHPLSAGLRCLALMATAGDEPAWNARQSSRGHQAIPLPTAESVRAAPMILRLMEDIGIDIEGIVKGEQTTRQRAAGRTYDVFHVEEARGSPFIPAQREFVLPHRIESVVGFGGLLRSGELFAVVLFSRDRIPVEGAARFRAIALDVRSALFNHDDATTWQT